LNQLQSLQLHLFLDFKVQVNIVSGIGESFTMLVRYLLCMLGSAAAHVALMWYGVNLPDRLANSTFALVWNVLFWGYMFTFAVSPHKHDGERWPAFQKLSFWRRLVGEVHVHVETPLNHAQNYIFTAFPHGAISLNHLLTMTNCAGFLSDVHRGDRRDLAASVLFYIPVVRELLLWLGNVDAGKATAQRQLARGRSVLIFVGGEKEQLMTRPNEHKVYARSRVGFVKLALENGVPLVPMYCFGENEAYHVSEAFMGLRMWLQRTFSLGISLCWGRGFMWMSPLDVALNMEIASPVLPPSKFAGNASVSLTTTGASEASEASIDKAAAVKPNRVIPSEEDIMKHHAAYIQALCTLFERTKAKYGVPADVHLEVL
jgi:hypothetical protein